MPTRRTFLLQTMAAGALASTAARGDAGGKRAGTGPRPATLSIKAVTRREETVLRYGGHGDNWHMSWASDDRQYVSLCDGAGFSVPPVASYNSRMLAISGGARAAQFHDLAGYPMLGKPTQGSNDPRYYNYGTLALDRYLYQYMSTFNRPFRPDDLTNPSGGGPVRFVGAKLIYSSDNGLTWRNQDGSTPVVWDRWDRRSQETMIFFEEDQEAFSLLSVLQMGKNYEQNRDGYVYVYSPNGNLDGTMNELVMFRVPKNKLLDRSHYEYFSGRGARGGARWAKDIASRAIVHTFPRGWVNRFMHPYAWHPSVVYNAPLDLYLMANWGTGSGTGFEVFSGKKSEDLWFTKPSYLGFWVAKDPWGPWTQIHEETAWMPEADSASRAYEPQISPKWISSDGKSFWIVWTDFQVTDREAVTRIQSDLAQTGSDLVSAEVRMVKTVEMMRKYMPYYAFNAQRVDLDVR